ncbi:MAG: alpha/beta hydrolase family protein [Anaerolineales bacterium]
MRTLEITLAIILFIRILLPLLNIVKWNKWVSLAAFAVMILQLSFEGYRWQMIPLYLLTLWFSAVAVWRLRHPISHASGSPGKKTAIIFVEAIIFLLFLTLPLVLPIPRTPEPTGNNNVGTIKLTLIDHARQEIYAKEPGGYRIINVQIWYPAELDPDAKPALWLDNMEVMAPALAAKLNLPSFFLDHIKYAQTHALTNAPLLNSGSKYPLLLFSHGWGGFKSQNTYQVEELASHGYIVAAPDHTYGAIASVFPDGSIALNNPDALPVDAEMPENEFLSAAQILGDQWAGDLGFVIDSLENPGVNYQLDVLGQNIDFTRVGVLGHSTGGGAAIEFCATDARCQAALGMDPYMDPVSKQVQTQNFNKPYMAMFSESWAIEPGRNNDIFKLFFNNVKEDRFDFYIQETKHYDFTDMPAFSPLAPYLGLKGTLNGEQVSKIINAYTLAFFDRYFRGDSGTILDKPSEKYPEMIYLP